MLNQTEADLKTSTNSDHLKDQQAPRTKNNYRLIEAQEIFNSLHLEKETLK